MAQTQVALGYSTATGRLRWIMIPDDDAQIARAATPGISVLAITNAQYEAAPDHPALQALVNTHRGAAPGGDRVIMMDAIGAVASWCYFDAACGDKVPAGLRMAANAWRSTDWPTSPPTRKSGILGQSGTFLRTAETDLTDIFREDQ